MPSYNRSIRSSFNGFSDDETVWSFGVVVVVVLFGLLVLLFLSAILREAGFVVFTRDLFMILSELFSSFSRIEVNCSGGGFDLETTSDCLLTTIFPFDDC